MTDEDVVLKFQQVVGVGSIYLFNPANPKHKRQYRWVVEGYEPVQFVVAMLWPWLGLRRRARIREVLTTVQAFCREEVNIPRGKGLGRPRGSRNRTKAA